MAYLIFNKESLKTGDMDKVSQCTSAIFNYQVLGGQVEFSGSNVPVNQLDIENESHWIPIVTLDDGGDSEPFRQHAWNSLRYKVISGDDVQVYVTSGVAG